MNKVHDLGDGVIVKTVISQVVRLPVKSSTKKNEFVDVTIRDGKVSVAHSITVRMDGSEESTEIKPVWPMDAGTFYEMLSQALSISQQVME